MTATANGLAAFEAYLEAAIERSDDATNRILIREHFALDDPAAKRGKRLRPRILIAAAEGEGAPAERAFGAAAAVELLHNFSLIHDDIEDRDELRHGRPTLWVRHGIPAALGAGDAMCALSYATLVDGSAALGAETVAAMARCLFCAHHEMTQGQSYDIGFESATSVTFDEYLTMIAGKTAAIFGASAELGALVAGVSSERAAAYGAMGRAYGMAFQVRDDLLGAWGIAAETGKPSGADIRRRKWSFPVAWAMSGPPSAERDVVASAYAQLGELDGARAERVIAALDALGARAAGDAASERKIDEAKTIAHEHRLDPHGTLAALFDATANRTS